jgi:hypothetical protein
MIDIVFTCQWFMLACLVYLFIYLFLFSPSNCVEILISSYFAVLAQCRDILCLRDLTLVEAKI